MHADGAQRQRREPEAVICRTAASPMHRGASARSTSAGSPDRTPRAAANAQAVAGFNPCTAPAPATASQGQRSVTTCSAGGGLAGARQAPWAQQDVLAAGAAGS